MNNQLTDTPTVSTVPVNSPTPKPSLVVVMLVLLFILSLGANVYLYLKTTQPKDLPPVTPVATTPTTDTFPVENTNTVNKDHWTIVSGPESAFSVEFPPEYTYDSESATATEFTILDKNHTGNDGQAMSYSATFRIGKDMSLDDYVRELMTTYPDVKFVPTMLGSLVGYEVLGVPVSGGESKRHYIVETSNGFIELKHDFIAEESLRDTLNNPFHLTVVQILETVKIN